MIYYCTYLNYSVISWQSCSKNTLNILHKRIVQIIKGCDYCAHTTPIFHKQNLLNLNDIYFMEEAKCMFTVNNKGLTEPNCNNIYKPIATIYQHKTRYSSANNYFIHSTNLATGRRSLQIVFCFTIYWALFILWQFQKLIFWGFDFSLNSVV